MWVGQGAPNNGFVFQNNITPNNENGRNCQMSPFTVAGCWPSLVFTNNLVLDNRSADAKIGDGPLNYPSNTIAATQAAILWVNPLVNNYRLQAGSPGHNAASDGTDIGVNWASLVTGLGFDPTGVAVSGNGVRGVVKVSGSLKVH